MVRTTPEDAWSGLHLLRDVVSLYATPIKPIKSKEDVTLPMKRKGGVSYDSASPHLPSEPARKRRDMVGMERRSRLVSCADAGKAIARKGLRKRDTKRN